MLVSVFFSTFACKRTQHMEKETFKAVLEQQKTIISEIREAAHRLHQSVNQTYGEGLPYGYHLDMVACNVSEYGHLVCINVADVLPLVFAGYFHDSIEDARQTYNDIMRTARKYMTEDQTVMASEIVYALTNEKGRSRDERAGEKYYAGIRATPYAPFVKLCDRLANVAYSCSDADHFNQRMKTVYKDELPHFLQAIDPHSDDPRFSVPKEMVEMIDNCLTE